MTADLNPFKCLPRRSVVSLAPFLVSEKVLWVGKPGIGQELPGLLLIHAVPLLFVGLAWIFNGLAAVALFSGFALLAILSGLWRYVLQRHSVTYIISDKRMLTLTAWPSGRLASLESYWPLDMSGAEFACRGRGRGDLTVRRVVKIRNGSSEGTSRLTTFSWLDIADIEGAHQAISVLKQTANGKRQSPTAGTQPEARATIANVQWTSKQSIAGGSLNPGYLAPIYGSLFALVWSLLLLFGPIDGGNPEWVKLVVIIALLGGMFGLRWNLRSLFETEYLVRDDEIIRKSPVENERCHLTKIATATVKLKLSGNSTSTFEVGHRTSEDGVIARTLIVSCHDAVRPFELLTAVQNEEIVAALDDPLRPAS